MRGMVLSDRQVTDREDLSKSLEKDACALGAEPTRNVSCSHIPDVFNLRLVLKVMSLQW